MAAIQDVDSDTIFFVMNNPDLKLLLDGLYNPTSNPTSKPKYMLNAVFEKIYKIVSKVCELVHINSQKMLVPETDSQKHIRHLLMCNATKDVLYKVLSVFKYCEMRVSAETVEFIRTAYSFAYLDLDEKTSEDIKNVLGVTDLNTTHDELFFLEFVVDVPDSPRRDLISEVKAVFAMDMRICLHPNVSKLLPAPNFKKMILVNDALFVNLKKSQPIREIIVSRSVFGANVLSIPYTGEPKRLCRDWIKGDDVLTSKPNSSILQIRK